MVLTSGLLACSGLVVCVAVAYVLDLLAEVCFRAPHELGAGLGEVTPQ